MYAFDRQFGKAAINKANDPAPVEERLNPRLRLLENIGTMPVYLVDGEMVRGKVVGSKFCRWYLDFTEGSNKAEAPEWMPEEIWIDVANLKEADRILLHELTEYNLMLDTGMTYDPAHDRANVVENEVREHPEKMKELLDTEKKKVIKRQQKQAQDAKTEPPSSANFTLKVNGRRLPDAWFDTFERADAYGRKYWTSKDGHSKWYEVVPIDRKKFPRAEDQQDVNAAGIILRAPDGSVLFLRRSDKGDHPGEWCFPGGGVEDGETHEDAARRELKEETGLHAPDSIDLVHKAANGYHTFGADVPEAYTPEINDEHDRYAWADIDSHPEPLHPGVKEMFELHAPKSEAKDMGGKDWRGLIKGMLKFFLEESEELEHQEAEDAKAEIIFKDKKYWIVSGPMQMPLSNGFATKPEAQKHLDYYRKHKMLNEDADPTKAEAQYEPKASGKDHCSACRHFTAPTDCDRIKGPVNAGGWCKYFDAKGASDSIAMDRDTQRTIDVDGRMRVASTPISKANVCEYSGHEIPDGDKLGLDPNKKYRLYRDPKELAKGASTFNNIQLLFEHVPVSAEDPKKDLVIGSTGTDAEFKAPYLMNSLVVWDKEAIDAIKAADNGKQGSKELSCAYRYTADMTPGKSPDGEAYDGVMRDIVGNHVALVEKGRAGSDVIVQDSMPKEKKQEFNWGFDRFASDEKPKPKAYDFSRFAKDDLESNLDASENGMKAAKEGKSKNSNPYPTGSRAYEQWNVGYRLVSKPTKDAANVASTSELTKIEKSGEKMRANPNVHISFK